MVKIEFEKETAFDTALEARIDVKEENNNINTKENG